MRKLMLIIDNVRSTHNVGSLLRTADGLGVKEVVTVGYTPTPAYTGDERLPHVVKRVETQLNKTALGAQNSLKITHFNTQQEAISHIKESGYQLWVLEQHKNAKPLGDISPVDLALVVGNEVDGVSTEFVEASDQIIEIPMKGTKNSFNVAVAGAIALYHISSVEN